MRSIKDTYVNHYEDVESLETQELRVDKMCELNVIKQVQNVCHTTIVQNAWRKGQPLSVHGKTNEKRRRKEERKGVIPLSLETKNFLGWIYDIKDGMLRDLKIDVLRFNQVKNIYQVEHQVASTVPIKNQAEPEVVAQQSESEAAHV